MAVLVSIVIPIYKTGSIISETIESCLKQTLDECEIILVNNHASQETLAAIEPYLRQNPGKLRVIYEPRRGVCSARNRGILEAKGQYVALLDHDDIMYPHRIQAQLTAAERHPEASLIHALFDRVSPDNQHILKKNANATPEFWRKLLFEPGSPMAIAPSVPPSVMFFKRDTAIRAKLFDEKFNPQWLEDTEFCLKMSEQGPFILVNESLVRWRVHPLTYMIARDKNDLYIKLRNQDRLYKILFDRYGRRQSKNTERAFRKIRSQWLREASFPLFPYKSGRQLAKYLVHRSLSENPFEWKTWKMWLRTCYPLSLRSLIFNFDDWINEPLPENLNYEFLKSIFKQVPASLDP